MKSASSLTQELLRCSHDKIRKSESKIRQVVDTIPALVWINLADGQNDFSNQRWQDYTGIGSEDARGWGWQAAVHPDDLPKLMETWQEMLAAGKAGEFEARLRHHDGVFRWFLCRIDAFRDESGKVLRWFGTATDIDALKQTEEQLRADKLERERLEDELDRDKETKQRLYLEEEIRAEFGKIVGERSATFLWNFKQNCYGSSSIRGISPFETHCREIADSTVSFPARTVGNYRRTFQ